jgi:hypothetical protein
MPAPHFGEEGFKELIINDISPSERIVCYIIRALEVGGPLLKMSIFR